VALKFDSGPPFYVLVTESITPRPQQEPEIRFQPSMLSVPTSASTVAPEDQAARKPPTGPSRRKLWFFAALSAVAGLAGAKALHERGHVSSQVVSGSPGLRQTLKGQDLHWAKKAVSVYLDESLTKIGPAANEAVMQAFGQWVASDKRLPDLSFDTGHGSATPAQDGKSTVSYARITAAGHEHDVAITVTYANDASGEILEADIVLNALYPIGVLTAKALTATTNGNDDKGDRNGTGNSSKSTHDESMDCNDRYDAQNVVTHEAGHFFGLGEDMTEKRATMFLSIDQCETHKRALQTTDVGALTTLYAKTEDPEEAAAGTRACSFGGAPAGSSGWAALTATIFGLSVWRRRRQG
jgi:hypothetical protein